MYLAISALLDSVFFLAVSDLMFVHFVINNCNFFHTNCHAKAACRLACTNVMRCARITHSNRYLHVLGATKI